MARIRAGQTVLMESKTIIPSESVHAGPAPHAKGAVAPISEMGKHPAAALLTIILVFVLLWGCTIVNQPLFLDQALTLVVADRMMSGAVLYKDVWDNNAPGNFLLYSLALLVFGNSPRSVYFLDIACRLATLLALYSLCKRLAGRRTALIAAAIFGVFSTYYWGIYQAAAQKDVLMTLFLVLAMNGFLKNRGALKFRPSLLVGVLIGLATLMKPIALFTYLYFLLFSCIEQVLKEKKFPVQFIRTAAGMTAGLLLPWAPFLIYEFWNGGLGATFDDLVLFNMFFSSIRIEAGVRGFYSLIERRFQLFLALFSPLYLLTCISLVFVFINKKGKTFLPILGWMPFILWGVIAQNKFFQHHWVVLLGPCVPIIAYGADSMLEAAIQGNRANPRCLIILFAGLGALFLYEPDWRVHLIIVAVILCAAAVVSFIRPQMALKTSSAAVLMILSLLLVFTRLRFSPSFAESCHTITGAFAAPPEVENYFPEHVELCAYINSVLAPEENILVWGWDPAIYYLSGHTSPTPFLYDIPLDFSFPRLREPSYFARLKERNFSQFIHDMKTKPPALIVVAVFDTSILERSDSKSELKAFPEFEEFLLRNYTSMGEISYREVYLANNLAARVHNLKTPLLSGGPTSPVHILGR